MFKLGLEAGKPSVCDIAQSFATAAHHEAALAADVFICPLHKHTGLATGLGLLGISDELDAPHLRAVAEMAEAGTVAFPTIRKALARAQLLEGRVINTFALQMDEAQAQELSTDGVSILSPLNQPLPFAVLRVADPEILHKIPFRSPFTIKQLSGERMIRVSGAIRGVLGDAPVDHSARLASVIRRAANPGGGLGR